MERKLTRRMSFTPCSAGAFSGPDFCLDALRRQAEAERLVMGSPTARLQTRIGRVRLDCVRECGLSCDLHQCFKT